MCCFAQPVVSVTDTNLFARLTDHGSQMLAYQMKFSSKEKNAMILPLPVKTPSAEDSVRFISLKGYDRFFKDLSRGFPAIPVDSKRSRSGSLPPSNSAPKLVVHDVGDFVASFVPTVDDFSRLDKQFVIPKESWDKIPGYSDFGFAVFQLKKLNGTTHPMAFEFKSRYEDQIFFPTVHIHDGEVHKREEFDHTLYLQASQFDEQVGKYVGPKSKDKKTGYVRSKFPARIFCEFEKTKGLVQGDQLVHRVEMRGRFANTDVVAKLASDKPSNRLGGLGRERTGNRSAWALAPVAALVAGFGWLINRRNKI